MSNEAKVTLNQVILVLVAPPYFFLLLNLVHPFLGFNVGWNGYAPSLDLDNNHYLGPWIGIYFFAYCVLFYFRKSENIFWITKLPVCGSAAIAILDPITASFDGSYLFKFLFLTGGAMIALFWEGYKNFGLKKVKFGDYPLAIDSKGHIKFPTDSLHMNVQIVGGTGTGKTHYVIKPLIEQSIIQDLGCFIYDVKGNMARDIAYYFSQCPSQHKKPLVHFQVADPKHSHTYNPLYGNNPDAIANRVFTALYYDPRNSEPYYVELGKAFLHNLVGLLKTEIKTITFLDLLLATEEAGTFRIIQWFCTKHSDTPYARYFKHQWLAKPAKQRQEGIVGASHQAPKVLQQPMVPSTQCPKTRHYHGGYCPQAWGVPFLPRCGSVPGRRQSPSPSWR